MHNFATVHQRICKPLRKNQEMIDCFNNNTTINIHLHYQKMNFITTNSALSFIFINKN